MAKRFKTTPFFRLLIALLIIVPSAYLAASYINGEDGIENIKSMKFLTSSDKYSEQKAIGNDSRLPVDYNRMKKELGGCHEEVEALRKQIEQMEMLLHEMRPMMEKISTKEFQEDLRQTLEQPIKDLQSGKFKEDFQKALDELDYSKFKEMYEELEKEK